MQQQHFIPWLPPGDDILIVGPLVTILELVINQNQNTDLCIIQIKNHSLTIQQRLFEKQKILLFGRSTKNCVMELDELALANRKEEVN